MLQLQHVFFSLEQEEKESLKILDNICLTVKAGEFFIILGKNGAGKSTLFKAIAGELPSLTGLIKLNEQNVLHLNSSQKAYLIGKVRQNPKDAVIPHFTLEENLSFAYRRGQTRGFRWHSSKHRRHFFQEKLALLEMGLENRLSDFASILSGGQKQALSLIMATLIKPEILLLDEHTSALDPRMADHVMMITEKIIKTQNITTLMITHNIAHALNYGDRVLILQHGNLNTQFISSQKNPLTLKQLQEFYI